MAEEELNRKGTSEEVGFQSVAESWHCHGGSYVRRQTVPDATGGNRKCARSPTVSTLVCGTISAVVEEERSCRRPLSATRMDTVSQGSRQ
jgi:hypothetical protein